MKSKYAVFIIGLSVALISCDGVPEADSVNCAGRGMEKSLSSFKSETERQAFIDNCESLRKEK